MFSYNKIRVYILIEQMINIFKSIRCATSKSFFKSKENRDSSNDNFGILESLPNINLETDPNLQSQQNKKSQQHIKVSHTLEQNEVQKEHNNENNIKESNSVVRPLVVLKPQIANNRYKFNFNKINQIDFKAELE